MSPALYCNPLPIPDYPRGAWSTAERRNSRDPHWGFNRTDWDFRELADPSVLFFEDKWYLYPSGGMAWWTEDFSTWHHHPINVPWIGYAPTIVQFGERFLLTASDAPIYEASHPLGPFIVLQAVQTPDGEVLKGWEDPMLFSDDDGRLFAYWGIAKGIFGAELDPKAPWKLVCPPALLIQFDPTHQWERGGYSNQLNVSCLEGAWMFKHGGTYHLTYSAPGTYPRYATGCYRATKPLGPFTYAERNPITTGPGRFVQGAGHGCIVRGPLDTVWAFYTCHVQIHHTFERRIGMDPIGVDANGDLYAHPATETPQWAPGVKRDPMRDNDAGMLALSFGENVGASSHAAGREPIYAVDQNPRTWWQAGPGDAAPWIIIDLYLPQEICAVRLHWKEPFLDYAAGVNPGAVQYRIDGSCEGEYSAATGWDTLIDGSGNDVDLLIDFRAFPAVRARFVKLTVLGLPLVIEAGLIDFTVFGTDPYPPELSLR